MFTKDSVKFFTLISFISILMFKLIDSPYEIVLFIKSLMYFFSPFLLALLFVAFINPLVIIFENTFKFSKFISIFISYISITLLFSIIFKTLIPIIIDCINESIALVPFYVNTFNEVYTSYLPNDNTFYFLSPHIQDMLDFTLNKMLNIFSTYSSNIFFYIFNITNFIFDILIGIILSIYILCEKETILIYIKNLLHTLFTKKIADNIVNFFNIFNNIFYNFILGQLLDSLILSIIVFLGFEFIFDLDNSIFFAFIIFITNMIPYFGPFIGSIFPIFITFLSSPIKSFWILIFLIILQQIDSNFISPKIMHNQVGLSPILIISSVMICGSLFGFIGVFLAIPFTAIIKYFLNDYLEYKRAKT